MSIDLDDLARDTLATPPTRVPDLSALRRRVEQRRRTRRIVAGAMAAPVVALAAVGAWLVVVGDDGPSQAIIAGETDASAEGEAAPTVPEQPETSEQPTSTEQVFVTVPDLVGLTVEEAEAALVDAGLGIEVVEVAASEVEPGTVVRTEPTFGSDANRGRSITVIVAGAPSQSADDAARDQIVPEVAALPASVRIRQVDDWSGPTRVDTAAGTWIISQPDIDAVDSITSICALGDPDGVYGRDYICPDLYAEILLLDSESGDIIRAYPFPEVMPESLGATGDALYCIRQGDGGVPDSLLCRIDLTSFDATVRVFPWASDSASTPDLGVWVPSSWRMDEGRALVLWERLDAADTGITISGNDGSAVVDPITLELVSIEQSES